MNWRRALAPILAVIATNCWGTTFGTDNSDLWSNENEQGWGVNIIQQADTLFATFFVYGPDGKPSWYVASSVAFTGNNAGVVTYSGALYQTSGPWFGGSFNPSAVGVRSAGTVTFSFDTIRSGTVTYTIDDTTVSKAITRQTWKLNDLNGTYLGATIGTYSNCPGASGYMEEPAYFSVTHASNSISIVASYSNATCTYSGTYFQDGRMGAINGNVSCSNGLAGTFSAYEIEANYQALSGRAQMHAGSCQWAGRIGGLRTGS